jgi:hypothetical protein
MTVLSDYFLCAVSIVLEMDGGSKVEEPQPSLSELEVHPAMGGGGRCRKRLSILLPPPFLGALTSPPFNDRFSRRAGRATYRY